MQKENHHIEFKSNFNDAVIETVSAFVNTKGGKVYIGRDDFGQPIPNFTVGKESIPKWINEIKVKTQPSSIVGFNKKINQCVIMGSNNSLSLSKKLFTHISIKS